MCSKSVTTHICVSRDPIQLVKQNYLQVFFLYLKLKLKKLLQQSNKQKKNKYKAF